jgi:hypothetical protein
MATRLELEAMAVAQALTLIQDLTDEEVEECEALRIELNLYEASSHLRPRVIAGWDANPSLTQDLPSIVSGVDQLSLRVELVWAHLVTPFRGVVGMSPPRGRSEEALHLDDSQAFAQPPIIGVARSEPTPGTVPVMVSGTYVSTYDHALHGSLALEGYDSNYVYSMGSTYSLSLGSSVSQVLGTPEEEAPSFWKLLTQD